MIIIPPLEDGESVTVNFLGYSYSVRALKDLRFEDHLMLGLATSFKQKIELEVNQAEGCKTSTFGHELGHVYLEIAGRHRSPTKQEKAKGLEGDDLEITLTIGEICDMFGEFYKATVDGSVTEVSRA